jgi:hypothetical protein
VSLTEDVDLARQNEELRAALRREQRRSARLAEKQEDLRDAVYTAARDAAVVVGRANPVARPARDRRRSPEVALLHLTDIQYGKQTPEYSSEIADERVRTVVQKALKLTAIQRADHPVRDCVLLLGGDIVEGLTVFPGQAYEVDSNAFTQVFRAAALIEESILTLLEDFETVTVYDVPGNHGRLGKRGDHPRADNLDNAVYRIVHDRINQPRLKWTLNETWYSLVAIGEYRALLVHGDQIKSFGGNVPAHGLLRKANSWAAGGLPESFQDVYVGHMHQPMTLQMAGGGLVYMTPSTESGSAYAREFMAAHGRPAQRLHFVHPERGRVTASYLIDLD